MIARTTAWLCVMGIALPLAAQTTAAPSTQPASATWTGAVTGTNVYVRYGPGPQAYPCTRLSAPERIVVVGKTDGWLRILAPKGCYSVISKDYVQVDATGRPAPSPATTSGCGQAGTCTRPTSSASSGNWAAATRWRSSARSGNTTRSLPRRVRTSTSPSRTSARWRGGRPHHGAAGRGPWSPSIRSWRSWPDAPARAQHPQPSREAGRLQDGREGPGRGVRQTPGAARP